MPLKIAKFCSEIFGIGIYSENMISVASFITLRILILNLNDPDCGEKCYKLCLDLRGKFKSQWNMLKKYFLCPALSQWWPVLFPTHSFSCQGWWWTWWWIWQWIWRWIKLWIWRWIGGWIWWRWRTTHSLLGLLGKWRKSRFHHLTSVHHHRHHHHHHHHRCHCHCLDNGEQHGCCLIIIIIFVMVIMMVKRRSWLKGSHVNRFMCSFSKILGLFWVDHKKSQTKIQNLPPRYQKSICHWKWIALNQEQGPF